MANPASIYHNILKMPGGFSGKDTKTKGGKPAQDFEHQIGTKTFA